MKLSLLLLTIFHGLNVAAASDSPNFNWDKSSATVTAKFSTGQYIVSGKYKINLSTTDNGFLLEQSDIHSPTVNGIEANTPELATAVFASLSFPSTPNRFKWRPS